METLEEPHQAHLSALSWFGDRDHRIWGRWRTDESQGRAALGQRDRTAGASIESSTTASPGILKIIGRGLASGANHKRVLATARELVAEALEHYGLASSPCESSGVDVFMLCDVLDQLAKARVGSSEWRPEHLRVLGDSERPLLVQELWRAAWSRKPSGAAVSEGTCAPLWQPEKNRSRVAPGGEVLTSPGSAGSKGEESWENLPFWRSMSELSLHGRRNAGRRH
ncbi:Hypothetical predicted protein [Marmota monax]|uniref:Ras-associating domain-containing protein n=1 Tax=Marmota monax TaxID=9995 RepID=A0A5E4BDJ3_MARMO|nr:hypothetical protein GHT09_008372 [Marmota monax]VTJ66692.1 Hypothetical predicted protein [Marmota monax]